MIVLVRCVPLIHLFIAEWNFIIIRLATAPVHLGSAAIAGKYKSNIVVWPLAEGPRRPFVDLSVKWIHILVVCGRFAWNEALSTTILKCCCTKLN